MICVCCVCLCTFAHVHMHWYAVNYIPGCECGSKIQCCYPPKPTQLSNLLNTAVVAVTHGSKTAQIDTHTREKNTNGNTHTQMLSLWGGSRKAEKTLLNMKDCLVQKSADSQQLISAVSLDTMCVCVDICVISHRHPPPHILLLTHLLHTKAFGFELLAPV